MFIVSEKVICTRRRGKPVRLQMLADDPYAKYCVQYCGGGVYFSTAREAALYLYHRFRYNCSWIRRRQLISIILDNTRGRRRGHPEDPTPQYRWWPR